VSIPEDAVVLITSGDSNNKKFGSGFIIAEDDQYSYVVSCAHVIEDVGNTPYITGLPTEILAKGSPDDLDMTLLKVTRLNKPCLNQFAQGIPKTDIAISGYSIFENRQVKRLINGRLGKSIKLTARNKNWEIAAFDITIQDDEFSKLSGGYSGSPLCNSTGSVIGIITHLRTGERGHALCISNLNALYPDIYKLISNFKAPFDQSLASIDINNWYGESRGILGDIWFFFKNMFDD